MRRISIALGALLLALTQVACVSGQGGPIAAMKAADFRADLEGVVVCPAYSCGADAICAEVLSLQAVRTVRLNYTDLARLETIEATGQDADRLAAAGQEGQLVRVNGKRSEGRMFVRELILPKSDLEQAVVGIALRHATRGICDAAEVEIPKEARAGPVAKTMAAPQDTHLLPELKECHRAARRARADLIRLADQDECNVGATGALFALDDFFRDHPLNVTPENP